MTCCYMASFATGNQYTVCQDILATLKQPIGRQALTFNILSNI